MDPLDLRGELLIGGEWVDATGSMLTRQAVVHTRGRQDQGARVDPSTCRPLLNNTDGRFSPDNPMSPYYGQFGRNTPFRLSVRAGTPALELDGSTTGIATTPDDPSLDITGDLDLRWEGETDWYRPEPRFLLGKWAESGNRVYNLRLENGQLWMHFVTAAGDGLVAYTNLPQLPPHAAVRATLDADNGAGGFTVRHYWAHTMTGPWTEIFRFSSTEFGPITLRGTTTAPLSIAPSDPAATPPRYPATGRVHRAEVRNGINGPLVAAPDFTAQTPGTTSFTDTAGRTWTVAGPAAITDRRTRLVHELAAYPTRWHPSGAHAWVEATTAGILRRLRRSSTALESTLRRRIPSGNPLAYWPMEDGAAASQFYSPIPGVRPLAMSGMALAADDSLAGSSALPTLKGGALLSGEIPAPTSTSTQWHAEFVFRAETGPETARTVLQWTGTGTVQRWQFLLQRENAHIRGFNAQGTEIIGRSVTLAALEVLGAWTRWKIFARQNGANVDYTVAWVPIGGTGGIISGSYAGTVGRISGVKGPDDGYSSDLDGLALGHISAFTTADTHIYNKADIAFTGETAGQRMQRLSTEEALPVTVQGVIVDQERVGPQRPDTVLELLEAAADADGGILYEHRERLALRYRDRASMYTQRPALVLDYNAPGLAPPLEPTGDDEGTQNDVTVTRVNGSSGRAVLTEGALSVQAPPAGVGPYPVAETLSLHSDEQAEPIAYWRLHLGTYEGRRYPQVRVMVHQAPPELLDQILAVDIGDRLVITNPPLWVAPGDVELIVQGYEETFASQLEWDIVFNCSPGEPWNVATANDPVYGLADTDGTQLAAAATDTATTLHVRTTAGPEWDAGSVPADVEFGGEVATVTAIAASLADEFGRATASGWGLADSGQAWTTSGGTADGYTVTDGTGRHVHATTGVTRHTIAPSPAADVDLRLDWSVSTAAAGATNNLYAVARYTDATHMYLAHVQLATSGAISLMLRKRNVSEVQLGSTYATGLTFVPGAWYRLRFQVTGTTLNAKVWPRGTTEPAAWQVTATDADLSVPGSVGVRSFVGSTSTAPLPITFQVDSLRLLGQRFTVQRSVNGVVKSHPAGTAVGLQHPAIAAL